MANDESPKIEPTLTSVSNAPSVVPSAEIPTPDGVKPEGSPAEAAKVDSKPAAPKSEDILAELARANAKNNVFLKPDSILAEVARAKAAAAKPDSILADAATENAKLNAPKPDASFPPASRLYIDPSAEKEPKQERKPKPEAKGEPTPEAKRQAYRSSVVVRMPPGSSSAASDAGVVVKPNVTRLALVAALMAIAASFGAVGGSVGVAKFGPIFASAPPPVAPVTKDNVAEEMKALKDTVAQLRATTKSLSDNLAALKNTVSTSNTAQNTQISKVSDALDRVEKTQADLRKTAAATATAAPAHMASTTQATATISDVTGSVKQQQPVPMVLGEPPQNLKPPVVPGWVLRRVYDGAALIEGRDGIIEVETGTITPGLGRIEGIKRQDGRWVVVTSRGLVIGR
jgi:Skp family chaperone for outer membrane proteins